MTRRKIFVLVLCLFPSLSYAEMSTPGWLRELTRQLAIDKDCEVSFYIRTKEDTAEGSDLVEARAKCKDGREFDAFRAGSKQRFVISECSYAVCSNTGHEMQGS